jgi:hypothetical protein
MLQRPRCDAQLATWQLTLNVKELVIVGLRFNPAPGWPPVPKGFVPPPGWLPDPAWPPAPPDWQLWVDDGQPPGMAWAVSVPRAAGMSGLAVASFVLGLLGFTLIGAIFAIIFGILALNRIRGTLERGKGLAIAGLVLSGAWILLIGGAIVLAAIGYQIGRVSGAPPVSPGANVPGGTMVSVFSLVTGDCFDNPVGTGLQTVRLVEKTPCNQPHNAQIFGTFNVKGSLLDYPGAGKLGQLAISGCNARLATSLDKAKVTDLMTVHFLFPLQASWIGGRRTISCIVMDSTHPLTSSVLKKGTAGSGG